MNSPGLQTNPDSIVIGAGVMGLLTAWYLAKSGQQVLVLDERHAFSGSSWAGGGILSPVPPWSYPPAVQLLVDHSLQLYPQLVNDLRGVSGIDPQLTANGLLYLGAFDQQSEQWLADNPDKAMTGSAIEWETGATDLPAWRLSNVMQIRNPRFGKALLAGCKTRSITIHANAAVQRIMINEGKAKGVILADGTELEAASVVLTAGAWSEQILLNSGLPGIGIQPVRGQIVLWQASPGQLSHVISGDGYYLIPRQDGLVLGGSTVEHVGFDLGTTTTARTSIQRACQAMYPPSADWKIVRQWSGLRPGIVGDIPVIDAVEQADGLWVNAGHYRNGLGMAPASAQLCADQVCRNSRT